MKTFPRLAADPGRIVANRDATVRELKLALFEAPQHSRRSDAPAVLLAASMISGWRRECIEVRHAGKTQMVQTAPRKSVLGHAATALDESDACNAIEVVVHDPIQWLTSCTDDDLRVGENLAVIGDEVVQFGEATALGAGRFRLGRLWRGRAGTTGTAHSKGEPFVLLQHGALQPIMLPVWKRGSPVWASARDGAIQCSLIPAFRGLAPEGVRLIF